MQPRVRSSRRTPSAETAPAGAFGPGHVLPAQALGVELARSGARATESAVQRSIDPARPESLLCGSPREVLARIVPGDPLAIRDVVAEVLRAECVFLDADRVHLRALARTARAALRFPHAGQDLRAWLAAQAQGAVAELLTEDLEAPRLEPGSAFVQFARPLGLDPEALRRGCAAFNRLPREDRAALFALLVEDVGLEAHARAAGTTPNEVGRRARRGLDAVLRAHHPDLPPASRAPAPKPACEEPR